MVEITLIRPDDWHCHLRDEIYLERTVLDTATRFARAVIMPNLTTPICSVEKAREYSLRIHKKLPKDSSFKPLMALYLKEETTVEDVQLAKQSSEIIGYKLYPAGATTHAQAGVNNILNRYPIFASMEEVDLPLLVHAEIPDYSVDIFDREAKFIEKFLIPIHQKFPKLRMVVEHISTQVAVDFIQSTPGNVAATITPQHLLFNRNDLLVGGIKPHHYCLPIVKRFSDQEALIKAAISGSPGFFLGTDSAPHLQTLKESACGCAGIYSACAAIEIYAEIFATHRALDKLEKFASVFGPNFYKLPINTQTITLINESWDIPTHLAFGKGNVVPLLAGQTIHWKIHA